MPSASQNPTCLWHCQQLIVAEWSAQGSARIFSAWRQMPPWQVTRPSRVLRNWTSDSINSCPVKLPRQGLHWTDCCYCWPHHTRCAGIWNACVEIISDEEDLCVHEGGLRHKPYLLQTWPNATESVIDLLTLTENKQIHLEGEESISTANQN